MLDSTILEGTNIVTAAHSGSLSADETARLRHQIEEVIATHGSARLLLEMGEVDLGRVEPKAVWEDLKSSRYLDDISRVALVGSDSFVSGALEAMGKLSSTQARAFGDDERDHALVWLQA